jgi:hypothetical protein
MTKKQMQARRGMEQKERQQRDAVIAEFTAEDPEATLQVMAAEILRYRHGMARVADAIAWIQGGAPFRGIAPGPLWQSPRIDAKPQ